MRPASVHKPAVTELRDQGVAIVTADLDDTAALVPILEGIDIVISAIGPEGQLQQLNLIDAATQAGVKRFVPCGFTTICPPGGIMKIRDDKEVAYTQVLVNHLPYTIIDVGYWHQISIPAVPSGKFDYALFIPSNTIYGDGNTPNLLTDLRDVGHLVARIVKDPRTLNKKVFTYGDILSQKQIITLVEKASGEEIETQHVSFATLLFLVPETAFLMLTEPGICRRSRDADREG